MSHLHSASKCLVGTQTATTDQSQPAKSCSKFKKAGSLAGNWCKHHFASPLRGRHAPNWHTLDLSQPVTLTSRQSLTIQANPNLRDTSQPSGRRDCRQKFLTDTWLPCPLIKPQPLLQQVQNNTWQQPLQPTSLRSCHQQTKTSAAQLKHAN
jgi:hypothetical protein